MRAKLCGCETIRLWLGAARFHDPGCRPPVRLGPCALRPKTTPLCESLLIAAKSLLIDSKSFPVASRCFSLLPAAFPLLLAAFKPKECKFMRLDPRPRFAVALLLVHVQIAANRC